MKLQRFTDEFDGETIGGMKHVGWTPRGMKHTASLTLKRMKHTAWTMRRGGLVTGAEGRGVVGRGRARTEPIDSVLLVRAELRLKIGRDLVRRRARGVQQLVQHPVPRRAPIPLSTNRTRTLPLPSTNGTWTLPLPSTNRTRTGPGARRRCSSRSVSSSPPMPPCRGGGLRSGLQTEKCV